jgi:hypothetical protein
MTRAELIAALRRGETLPAEMLAVIADYLEPPKRGRGRPRRDGEKELAEAMALIGRVETLSASLGTRQRAFNALASGRMHAATVERYYRRAKRLEKVLNEWSDAMTELTRVIKNTLLNYHPD